LLGAPWVGEVMGGQRDDALEALRVGLFLNYMFRIAEFVGCATSLRVLNFRLGSLWHRLGSWVYGVRPYSRN
jgi:hypothetical protein